ncbi:MAG: sulfatase [Verrucomicrobia bacterium]|nr:sulfatase [Verrucomicrobiota bacterium]
MNTTVHHCYACAAAAWLSLAAMPAQPAPYNVVLILADDLGWADLGCYGADLHQTPHIDQLARDGVRFTQAYAMPVCSPTRAALLTGRHAARLHMTIWREGALKPAQNHPLLPAPAIADLPLAEVTLAEKLKAAGYLTFHVGKWHLGDAGHSPETQGFDVNIGGTHWGAPPTYFHPFRGEFGQAREFRYVPGLGPGKPGDYLDDRLTDEALEWIDTAGDRPFFLNLWFHLVHTPIEGKTNLVETCRARIEPGMNHQNPDYAAMVQTMDQNVGRVLQRLEQRRLRNRTLVIFASDNGGYTNQHRGRPVTSNAPLRSGKGSLYEGGIRVPLIVRLPGMTPPGGVCEEPVMCTDWFPTIAEVCGLAATRPPAPAGPLDGQSLVPLLRQPNAHLNRDALFFHYPHYYTTTTPASAVRAGDWKLLEYFEDNHLELYHLRDDVGERHNQVASQPHRAAQLRARLHAWRTEVGARLPSRRPK